MSGGPAVEIIAGLRGGRRAAGAEEAVRPGQLNKLRGRGRRVSGSARGFEDGRGARKPAPPANAATQPTVCCAGTRNRALTRPRCHGPVGFRQNVTSFPGII